MQKNCGEQLFGQETIAVSDKGDDPVDDKKYSVTPWLVRFCVFGSRWI
jgi:hypothetical protein